MTPDPYLCAACKKPNASHGVWGRHWHMDCLPDKYRAKFGLPLRQQLGAELGDNDHAGLEG